MSNIEQFGQYPLQVNGFNNLDECLEGAMVEREIESLHPDQTITSAREVNQKKYSNCRYVFIYTFCVYKLILIFYNTCFLFSEMVFKAASRVDL